MTATGRERARPLRLVVLGDSTSFTDDSGPRLPDHQDLYPNVAARRIEVALGRSVAATVVARPAMTVREALQVVRKDRHVQFDVIGPADALVVGVGSYDHAPTGPPAVVDAIIPHLRPATVRRRVRAGLHRAHPQLVRLTGGRVSRTARSAFATDLAQLLDQLRGLTWGRAAGVVLGPTSHRAAHYAHRHPQHGRREALQLSIAAAHGFAVVPVWRLVQPYERELNADGIHWPAAAHRAVGDACAGALLRQLRGDQPAPGLPDEPPGRRAAPPTGR